MENSFIPKAIDTVKDAIAADTAQEYEIALGLYKKSLEYFMTGLKYESNPVGARPVCGRFCVVPALFLLLLRNCEHRLLPSVSSTRYSQQYS